MIFLSLLAKLSRKRWNRESYRPPIQIHFLLCLVVEVLEDMSLTEPQVGLRILRQDVFTKIQPIVRKSSVLLI